MTPVAGSFQSTRSRRRAACGAAVGHDHHAGVLRVTHADTAAVVNRYPRGARGTVQQGIEHRPVRDGVGAVLHRFGFAVRRGDRARIEMVAADHDGRLQLAAGDHLVKGESQPVAVAQADPADPGGQTLKLDLRARARSSQ